MFYQRFREAVNVILFTVHQYEFHWDSEWGIFFYGPSLGMLLQAYYTCTEAEARGINVQGYLCLHRELEGNLQYRRFCLTPKIKMATKHHGSKHLGSQHLYLCEFQDGLVYKTSLLTARATQRDLVSKQNTINCYRILSVMHKYKCLHRNSRVQNTSYHYLIL